MNQTADISISGLILAFAMMAIPVLIFKYLKSNLIKDSLIAVARMSVQLFFVGFYLKYIFLINSMLLNIVWALVMIFIASYTVIRRTKIKGKTFLLPVFSAIFISLFIIDIAFLGFMIDIDYKFEARYFVPITGMIVGNLMKADVMALNTYYTKLNQEITLYRYLLANGSGRFEALIPFMREAMHVAMNPLIASTAVTGLIALPGMMTGQLLGGSLPTTAIKYQIVIITTIFVASVLTIFLTLLISNRFSFDKYGNFDSEAFKTK